MFPDFEMACFHLIPGYLENGCDFQRISALDADRCVQRRMMIGGGVCEWWVYYHTIQYNTIFFYRPHIKSVHRLRMILYIICIFWYLNIEDSRMSLC